MLTESCVMFFSPSLAVLSYILPDEYWTSAVRTKEGEPPRSNIHLAKYSLKQQGTAKKT